MDTIASSDCCSLESSAPEEDAPILAVTEKYAASDPGIPTPSKVDGSVDHGVLPMPQWVQLAGASNQPSVFGKSNQWRSIVQILIGKSEKEFLIHKHVVAKIPHFERCLHNGWREAQEGVWKLPDEDTTAFEEVVSFLYHRRFSYNLSVLMWNGFRPSDS